MSKLKIVSRPTDVAPLPRPKRPPLTTQERNWLLGMFETLRYQDQQLIERILMQLQPVQAVR